MNVGISSQMLVGQGSKKVFREVVFSPIYMSFGLQHGIRKTFSFLGSSSNKANEYKRKCETLVCVLFLNSVRIFEIWK